MSRTHITETSDRAPIRIKFRIVMWTCVNLSSIYPEFPFSMLIRTSTGTRRFAKRSSSSVLVQGAFHDPQRTSSASRWHKTPETDAFPTEFSDTYPFAALSRHRNLLRSAGRLSRWRRQRRDPPQHACEEPARQMTLRQQQPVVPGMLYQTPAGFHQPLLQAGQRPTADPRRQHHPPPQVAQVVGDHAQPQPHLVRAGKVWQLSRVIFAACLPSMESRDLAGLSLRCRRIACRPREILCYDYLLTTPPTHSSDNRSRHPKCSRSRGARSLAPSGNRAVSL